MGHVIQNHVTICMPPDSVFLRVLNELFYIYVLLYLSTVFNLSLSLILSILFEQLS